MLTSHKEEELLRGDLRCRSDYFGNHFIERTRPGNPDEASPVKRYASPFRLLRNVEFRSPEAGDSSHFCLPASGASIANYSILAGIVERLAKQIGVLDLRVAILG